MKKAIVITSIFEPNEVVESYVHLDDSEVIVVADKKTPSNWSCEGVEFISIERQDAMDWELSAVLPYNHYCRKMLGYLRAVQIGADCIIDTDDDNHPKPNWGFPSFNGEFESLALGEQFVNIYQWFTDAHIWPRGLPLDLITKSFNTEADLPLSECNVGIWQGLADEDPDVDAIYRLSIDKPCYFNERDPLILQDRTICPFNSQNTAFRKELFPLLYLPAHVTFRFTDILRSLVAQPIMWLYGYKLGFLNATVLQKRNPHDYMSDFNSEIPMYLNCRKVVDVVSTAISTDESMESNLYNAYVSLLEKGIVEDDELRTLEAWLNDLQRMSTGTSS
jgi:hypothetical protein